MNRFQQNLFKQEILHSEIHKLIMLIWNKEELPHQWKESIVIAYLFTERVIKLTVVIIETSLLSISYKILSNVLLSKPIPYADEMGTTNVGFDVISQRLIKS
jgi:hypothetical protein